MPYDVGMLFIWEGVVYDRNLSILSIRIDDKEGVQMMTTAMTDDKDAELW